MTSSPLRRSVATFLVFGVTAGLAMAGELVFSALPELPPAASQAKQHGQAAPFAGAHGDALIVAGGANFPRGMPWDGGAKVWWDDVFVLEPGATAWRATADLKLPRALAYGFSFSTAEGVVCVGGCDAERCYREVFLLSWDAGRRELTRRDLPPLPAPLAFMAGAQIGSTIYVLGGQQDMKPGAATRAFWSLDLARRGTTLAWLELPAWPGPARIVPVAAGVGGKVYLVSGREPRPGRAANVLADAFAFDPATRAWRVLPPPPRVAMAASAAEVGGELWVFGGDDGILFAKLEALDRDIAAATARNQPADMLLRDKRSILESHPGFARDVLAFDPRRGAWRIAAVAPEPLAVTTIAVPWRGGWVIPSGEVRPGVRTTAVLRVAPGR